MNRKLHGVVYDRGRQAHVVVSERGSRGAAGGAGSAVVCGAAPVGRAAAWLSGLVAVLVLTGLTAGLVQAQIIADPRAAGSQRPIILKAGNGVPVVNIQTPSAAGVSRNIYSRFDVGAPGAILNNGRRDSATRLGGWIAANPWLARGSARVILNEVNSVNPSRLHGWVEVAGPRADVILVNPAGIQVKGGGFINAQGVTLSTGQAILSAGALQGYRVQGGTVHIEDGGLDTSDASYTRILARAVQVNDALWAQQLKLVTGLNRVDADSHQPEPAGSAADAQTPPPFALDVARLGGMYAGQIHLVGTEAGVGVRNAGVMAAQGGALVLHSNGWLHSSGVLQATTDLRVHTQGDLTLAGQTQARANVQARSAGVLTQQGQLSALGQVQLKGQPTRCANS